MTRQLFERLSYLAILIIFLLLILMWLNVFPQWSYIYILIFCLILFALRITFRIYFDRKEKNN